MAATGGALAVASWLVYGDRAGWSMTAATAAAILLAGANPRGSDVGFVYLIHDPRLGVHKIGWSKSPHDRLERLEADCGTRLRMVAYGPGSTLYERSLHDRFADRWVATPHAAHTEWFSLTPQEAALVADELRRRN